MSRKFIKLESINVPSYTRKVLLKLMMRTFIFLFCTTVFSLVPNHLSSQNHKIVIHADKVVAVDEVFDIIKAQTDYMFVFYEDLFKDFPKVSLKKGTIRLNALLNQSISRGKVNVIFTKDNTILIKRKTNNSKALQRTVSGTVKDQSGLSLPGVTVLIKGTRSGSATNIEGHYTITVPDPANVLMFSSLGFETLEITVGNQSTINVSLKESISALDEVTIEAGYYKTSQRVATGSIGKMESKAIEKQPVNNPLAAMQGHISGVNITQSTGVPGGGYNIQIRGQNFISELGPNAADLDPLYIIDGVPYASGSLEAAETTGTVLLGGHVSPLNTINPADIKSIEVLKDADATAIYGARGANGVVLITTKKGVVGKTQIKLDVSTTLSESTGFIDLMNTQQYLDIRRRALENAGHSLETPPENIFNANPDVFIWDQDRYTDWQEVLLGNTAYRQKAQLSFSGGSEQTQFLVSAGHSSETTVFPGDSKYEKTTLNFNINHQSKNKRFNLNLSGNYGTDTNNLPGQDLTEQARKIPPNAPALYNDDGSINYWGNFGSAIRNPLAFLETNYNAVNTSYIGNAVLSYRPIKSLEFKTNLGYTDNRLDSYWAQPHTQFGPADAPGNTSESSSRLVTNSGQRQSWIIEPQINWKLRWGAANIKALVGATFQQQKEEDLGILGDGFSTNALLLNMAAANDILIFNDSNSDYKYQSFFGRLNFNIEDTYILNFTGRRDGSSRFGPGKQFGLFGAIGAAWVFSKENFLADQTVLSFGKLRSSYGITGSDSTLPNYAYYDSYEIAGTGLSPARLFNPNLIWGEVKKLEVALELGFFKDRIFISTAWYRNRSTNQLINAPLPTTTGFSGINANLPAIIENTGFEIDLRTISIQTDHFKWSTTFNISANRNKLVAFPGIEGSPFDSSYIVGESLSTRRLFRYVGVDIETGFYQVEDLNNDGIFNREDATLRLDLTPKYFGGLGNAMTYKNLQLNVFFQFEKKKISKYEALFSSTNIGNLPVTLLDRWQQPGDRNAIHGVYLSNSEASEAFGRYGSTNEVYIDGSYIRLQSVSLSYTVPKTFTKGLDLNVYLQGQNLFTITPNFNAARAGGGTLAPLRQMTLGLNLGF